MKYYVNSIIDVILGEVGYLEKETNRYLNYKVKNHGDKNYTKYGKWYGANGVFWCAEFVSWCFYKAYGTEVGKKLLCGGYSASCEEIRNQFKKNNRYSKKGEKVPQKGWVIFFSGTRHSGANHIGIVYKVDAQYVYTVEGNTSGGSGVVDNGGGVFKKKYKKSDDKVLGYGIPAYDVKKTTVEVAKPTLKRGMNGAEVKKLQINLNRTINAGLLVDGSYGEKTEMALRNFKLMYNIGVDGSVYGNKCYSIMKAKMKN